MIGRAQRAETVMNIYDRASGASRNGDEYVRSRLRPRLPFSVGEGFSEGVLEGCLCGFLQVFVKVV